MVNLSHNAPLGTLVSADDGSIVRMMQSAAPQVVVACFGGYKAMLHSIQRRVQFGKEACSVGYRDVLLLHWRHAL